MNPQDQLSQLVATTLYGFAAAGVRAGLKPADSLRLTAFGLIEAILGREATESLGLPYSTAARWRATLANIDADALEDEGALGVDFMNELLRLSPFRELRMQVVRDVD